MTQLEYEYLRGKLEGFREALRVIKKQNYPDMIPVEYFIAEEVLDLNLKLQGITVHDEVAELKAQLEAAIADFKEARSLYRLEDPHSETAVAFTDVINRLEALKSLEEEG